MKTWVIALLMGLGWVIGNVICLIILLIYMKIKDYLDEKVYKEYLNTFD